MEKVFSSFLQMDSNNDNVVTLEEMLGFFSVVQGYMSDKEFEATVQDMMDGQEFGKTVDDLVKMAGEGPSVGAGDDEEGAEELPALTEEKAGLVKAFYESFKGPDGIDLASVQDGKINIGPSTVNVRRQTVSHPPPAPAIPTCALHVPLPCSLARAPQPLEYLKQMDLDGNGIVDEEEVSIYFKVIGSTLDDESFKSILEELTGHLQASKNMKMAQA